MAPPCGFTKPDKGAHELILTLLTGPASIQRRVVTRYFAEDCSYSHPLCRVPSFDYAGSRFPFIKRLKSRDLILAMCQLCSLFGLQNHVSIEALAYDSAQNKIFAVIHQKLQARFLWSLQADVRLVTVLDLRPVDVDVNGVAHPVVRPPDGGRGSQRRLAQNPRECECGEDRMCNKNCWNCRCAETPHWDRDGGADHPLRKEWKGKGKGKEGEGEGTVKRDVKGKGVDPAWNAFTVYNLGYRCQCDHDCPHREQSCVNCHCEQPEKTEEEKDDADMEGGVLADEKNHCGCIAEAKCCSKMCPDCHYGADGRLPPPQDGMLRRWVIQAQDDMYTPDAVLALLFLWPGAALLRGLQVAGVLLAAAVVSLHSWLQPLAALAAAATGSPIPTVGSGRDEEQRQEEARGGDAGEDEDEDENEEVTERLRLLQPGLARKRMHVKHIKWSDVNGAEQAAPAQGVGNGKIETEIPMPMTLRQLDDIYSPPGPSSSTWPHTMTDKHGGAGEPNGFAGKAKTAPSKSMLSPTSEPLSGSEASPNATAAKKKTVRFDLEGEQHRQQERRRRKLRTKRA